MNTTIKSINSIYDGVRNYRPERCVGEITELPNSYTDWEVELQWVIRSGFSLGPPGKISHIASFASKILNLKPARKSRI